jgi:repressor LexA
LFALKINGDSMSRVIPPNSIAVFAKDACIKNGDVVAVLIDGQDAAIKKYQETSLAVTFSPDSYDPAYQPIIFPKTGEQDFRILGKMILFQGGEELNI